MKKMTHNHCIRNFLLGFGSILNIVPVVSAVELPQTDGQDEAEQLIRSSWNTVGEHLTHAMNTGKNNEQ